MRPDIVGRTVGPLTITLHRPLCNYFREATGEAERSGAVPAFSLAGFMRNGFPSVLEILDTSEDSCLLGGVDHRFVRELREDEILTITGEVVECRRSSRGRMMAVLENRYQDADGHLVAVERAVFLDTSDLT